MRRITSFSIRAKMITMVAGALLLAILSAAYVMRGMVYQNIVDQKMTTADILTASLVHDIKYEYDFRSGNRESIKDIISKYLTYYRVIESISFYDDSYTNIADSNPEKVGEITQDRELVRAITLARPSLEITRLSSSNLGIRSIFPILRGSRVKAAIDMHISITDIKAIMSAIDHRIATILIFTILMACAALFILLRGVILQRLSRLMEVTRQIAAGNYDIQVKDIRKDELGQLAQAFDQMTSELQKSKLEIEDYNQHLEAKVQQATAQLNQAYEDLKNTQSQLVLNEKMACLGVLIAGIAHEINTPVGAIHNVARNLEQRVTSLPKTLESFKKDQEACMDNLVECFHDLIQASAGDQQVTSFKEIRTVESILRAQGINNYRKIAGVLGQFNFMDADKITRFANLFKSSSLFSLFESIGSISQAARIVQTSSRKIEEIVRALKYYAYTDKDRIEMTQLNESIKTALVLLSNRLKHSVVVTTQLDPELPKISCTSEVHQIWTNLLNNACDAVEAMGDGYQGEILVSTQQRAGRSPCDNGQIVVTVTDNGIGIPEDKIGRIFDPFFTTKDIGKGTGLGLSIVSGIIKKHNGTIRVESKRGHTVFEITFPIKVELPHEGEQPTVKQETLRETAINAY
ncbi:MAG: ATP-binding protein [bacterium]